MSISVISKSIFIFALAAVALFLLLGVTGLISWAILDEASDVFQAAMGIAAGSAVLAFWRRNKERYAALGTALAIYCWSLGEIFWFSGSLVTGIEIPYPSVGDLGFVGMYFILFSAMTVIRQNHPELKAAANGGRLFLILFAVPVALAVFGGSPWLTAADNLILGLSAVWAMYRAASLWRGRAYRSFAAGVLLLGATDIIFISCVVLFPEGLIYITSPLYPAALALTSYGIIKGEAGA
jgi:hypothetical protein